jgi:hypothetical protein
MLQSSLKNVLTQKRVSDSMSQRSTFGGGTHIKFDIDVNFHRIIK